MEKLVSLKRRLHGVEHDHRAGVGKGYCAFISQEMFRPLSMTDTACEDPGTILKQRASGYVRINDTLANAPYVDPRFVNGAGSIFSTLDNLLLWNRALDANRILNTTATTKLFTSVKMSMPMAGGSRTNQITNSCGMVAISPVSLRK